MKHSRVFPLVLAMLCCAPPVTDAGDSVISAYASAQRMEYNAVPTRVAGGDKYHFFFLRHESGHTDPPVIMGTQYWEVDSGACVQSRIMSGNQHPASWRFDAGHPLFVAIRMMVAHIDTMSAHDAISVRVIHVHESTASRDTAIVHVPWREFHSQYTDTLCLSPAPICFPHPFTTDRDSLLCEVWSEHCVTTMIESVTIEDERARDLFTNYQIGGRDKAFPAWAARRNAIVDSIRTGAEHGVSGAADFDESLPVSEWSASAFVGSLTRSMQPHALARGEEKQSLGVVIERKRIR